MGDRPAHVLTWAKVNAPVDEGVKMLVEALSAFDGLETVESCEGPPRLGVLPLWTLVGRSLARTGGLRVGAARTASSDPTRGPRVGSSVFLWDGRGYGRADGPRGRHGTHPRRPRGAREVLTPTVGPGVLVAPHTHRHEGY